MALGCVPQFPTDDKMNIASSNGLVLSGTKPLPESMLTKFYNIIWHSTAASS